MILAVAAGNTHVTFGCIDENNEIGEMMRISTQLSETALGYAVRFREIFQFLNVDPKSIEGAVLSSVVPPLGQALREAVFRLTGKDPLVVGAGVKTGLRMKVDDPGTALSFLILPNKEAAMVYFAFFGCYPILKPVLESKIKNDIICWIIKALFFNATAVAAYSVIIYVMGMPLDEFDEFGKWAIPILLGLGNVMFILYDICITRIVTIYLHKWQKKFRSLFKFR